MVCMRLVPSEIPVEHRDLLGKLESSLILLLRGRALESRIGLEKAVVEPVCRHIPCPPEPHSCQPHQPHGLPTHPPSSLCDW